MKRLYLFCIIISLSTASFAQFSHSFTQKAHMHDGSWASSVAVSSDGTVFTAGGLGLTAYSYNGTSFTKITSINNGGIPLDIAIAPDGTLFLANDDDGLRAYSFDGASFTNTAHVDDSNNGNFCRGRGSWVRWHHLPGQWR